MLDKHEREQLRALTTRCSKHGAGSDGFARRLVAEDQTCCMSTDPEPLLGESKADLTYAR